MRRFIEVLLLASCTFSLPPSFANGLQLEALHPTVKHNALRKGEVIRGLLDARQYYCPNGHYQCSSTTCCPGGWNCCRDGNCCNPGYYCSVASNGNIGCCPNGRLCSGPVLGPTQINPSPPKQTTNHDTSTTTINHFTTTSTSRSTPTFTTHLAASTQSVGNSGTLSPSTPNPSTPNPSTPNPSTPNPPTPTGLALSAARRAQPYPLLLAFGGILLAVIYCA